MRAAFRYPMALKLLVLGAVATLPLLGALPTHSADRRPDYSPVAYAIKGAKIVTGTGTTIDVGTVVIRKGMIESVGPEASVAIPADAEVVEGKGLVVYPGFIDAYTTLGQPAGAVRSKTGAGRNVSVGDFAYASTPPDNRNGITPEFSLAEVLDLPDSTAEARRKLGFTSLVAAPAGAIVTGQSVLTSLSGLPRREAIIKGPVSLHIALATPFEPQTAPSPDNAPAVPGRRGRAPGAISYPTSLMGVIAHLRQAMLDADHQAIVQDHFNRKGGVRPVFDLALEALQAARTKKLPVWWEANTRDEIHRALDLSEEFGTSAVIVGGREAAKVADRLKAKGVPVILKIDFPAEPKTLTEAEYRAKKAVERDDSLRVVNHHLHLWKERVGTAAALHKAGVKFALSSEGLTKSDTIHSQVRKMIGNGLPKDAALAALTTDAAEIVGIGKALGTIEKGKTGHLVVFTAPYETESAKAKLLFADGIKFDLDKPTPGPSAKSAEGKGVTKGGPDGAPGKGRRPRGDASEKPDDSSTPAKKVDVAKKDEPKNEPKDPEVEMAREKLAQVKRLVRNPDDPTIVAATKALEDAQAKAAAKTKDQPKTQDVAKKDETAKAKEAPKTPFVDVASELDSDRHPAIKTGRNVLIKNAVILTVTKGTIPKGSILIRDGKITAIGTVEKPLPEEAKTPEGITVIDANGLVAMPGIIDPHSHMAIQGGVNEMSLSIVPEVRVKDVVSGSDSSLYRALAGGNTTARLLHGSANTIGGQDAVIKLGFDKPARDLVLRQGPQGVKFALGENVTRRTGRFPNTRMGVEAVIERAFQEGVAYKAEWARFAEAKAKGEDVVPPRRDLRLEALANIVDGSIRIHSHCYRNDEILMLLRLAERHGIRVQSLQHVLEGYKVAAEIAAHGAVASTFSDWWAYKIEAFDAIPHNAGLLTMAGATVSLNSDSEEVGRHLYLEAAKMVKYGALTEEQALSMITINPARELGREKQIGSIEVGKDGDIALFNGHPFSGFARCELTIVDGEVAFQRDKTGKFAARPGTHTTIPKVDPKALARALDLSVDDSGRYAIVGATVHPVAKPDITRGVVLVEGGKILAVGDSKTAIPAGFKKIDAEGLDLWPGLIDAGTPVGLFEIGSLSETQDNTDSARYQPELRVSTAIHPDSELIPVTRANGVLSTLAVPKGGVIAGQAAVIDMDGWLPPEMVRKDLAALVVNIPTHRPRDPDAPVRRFGPFGAGGGDDDADARRTAMLDGIKEQFKLALAYDKVREAATAQKVAAPVPDLRMLALLPYAKGEKMVLFAANRRVEILDALKLAKELKLKAGITGGQEAWKVTEELKAAGVPVFVGGTLYSPIRETDPYDAPYSNPARLQAAGVPFAIRSAEEGADEAMLARNLPYEAATAIAYGLPEADALKAVTLSPAKLLGVDDQLGSVEPGKRANLVLTIGHILQPTTVVKGLFIGGKPLTPESRHTRLYEKFKVRLKEVQSGKAPLGLDRAKSSGEGGKPATRPAAIGTEVKE